MLMARPMLSKLTRWLFCLYEVKHCQPLIWMSRMMMAPANEITMGCRISSTYFLAFRCPSIGLSVFFSMELRPACSWNLDNFQGSLSIFSPNILPGPVETCLSVLLSKVSICWTVFLSDLDWIIPYHSTHMLSRAPGMSVSTQISSVIIRMSTGKVFNFE